jgi:hypothetical protein
MLGDTPSAITAINPRVEELVASTRDALTTARRLGVTELGTSRRPLYVHLTADPAVAGTPMFMDRDTLLLGVSPINDRGRRFLERAPGAQLAPGATWLDVDLGAVVPHETGHGVLNELVPQLMQPTVQVGPWRTRGFDQRVAEEAGADVFAGIHQRDWTMTLGGLAVRDAATGIDHVAEGPATIDALNAARDYGRSGADHPSVAGVRELDGSTPHALAGVLTPAYAIVERHHGWDATEAVFTDTLARLRERAYPVDVPATAKETARASAALLGPRDPASLEVRRLLMTNGAMG